jgi:signal peptide peptidase SppA
MNRFPYLAQQLFNTPIAIHPQKAEMIMAALSERLGITHLVRHTGQITALAPDLMLDDDDAADHRPYTVVNAIAVIPVCGTLVQKLGSMRPYSGMTGYDGIRTILAMALADTTVRAIILDIDSPGGEVAGCFDLVDAIYTARGTKPLWAVLNENAYSAAYAIASACDHITVPRTGGTGSIGVIAMLVDISKALAAGGTTVNIIQFGARKSDGAACQPLADAARDRFQNQIDTTGELFVDTVARNRNLKASAIRATEAATYMGAAGIEIGLADALLAPDARAVQRCENGLICADHVVLIDGKQVWVIRGILNRF